MNKLDNYFANKFSLIEFVDEPIVNVYTSYKDEVRTLRYGVGIHNRSHTNIIKMNGKDVCDLLQRISTNDIDKLENFHYINTLFLNEKSRLIDRTTLIKFEEDCYLVGSYDKALRLQRWIERYIIDEDINLENINANYLLLEVLGPQAESYLTLICGKEVDNLDNNKLHRVDVEGLKFHLLKKESLTGEIIYWIIADIIDAVTIVEHMLTHTSVFDMAMIGEKALDSYRIKKAIPAFPNEINDKYNPFEAGLMKEVSTTKKNYIGYELLHELKLTNNVEKKLKRIILKGDLDVKKPFELLNSDGNIVGVITSIAETENKKVNYCLCYVQTEYLTKTKNSFDVKIKNSNNILELVIKD